MGLRFGLNKPMLIKKKKKFLLLPTSDFSKLWPKIIVSVLRGHAWLLSWSTFGILQCSPSGVCPHFSGRPLQGDLSQAKVFPRRNWAFTFVTTNRQYFSIKQTWKFWHRRTIFFRLYFRCIMAPVASSCCFESVPTVLIPDMRISCSHACPTFLSQAKVCGKK